MAHIVQPARISLGEVLNGGWMASQSDLTALLTSEGTIVPADLTGLSDEAIEEVERDQGTSLPRVYRLFLSVAGGGAGRLWVGSKAFHPEIIGLRRAATELLAENGSPFQLSQGSVVFLMHQGYQFLFFDSGYDDPPVYSYVEGDRFPNEIAPSFTAFLRGAVL